MWSAALVLAGLCVLVSLVGAVEAEPVTLCVPQNPELAGRIRGQIQDVDVPVNWSCNPGRGLTITATVTHDSTVLWVQRPGRTPKKRSLRRLDSSSATQESAALAVRGILKAMAEGIEPLPPKEALVEAKTPVDKASTWRARLSAGLQARLSGLEPIAPAVRIRAGILRGRGLYELGVSLGWARTLEAQGASIALREREGWLSAGWLAGELGAFALTVGGRTGIVFISRQTRRVAPGFRATPDAASVAGLVGAEARVGFRAGEGDWWGLELLGGLDAVFGAPEIFVGNLSVEARRGWPVRPRAALLFSLDTPSW